MRSIIYSFALFSFIFFNICQTCLSQDTCYTSSKYGDNPSAGNYANINGIKMYYETYGDITKQPLLVLHGNGGSIYWMRCQIEYFKNKYFIIAVDSRFHGKSNNGIETLTYDIMAKDCNALLDYLKIDSAFVLGQSDGGEVGLIMAIHYPQKVKKLVTTAPNLQPDSTALEGWLVEYIKNELRKVEHKISQSGTSEELVRQKAWLDLMDKNPNLTIDDLKKITSQILIMVSDADCIKLEHILTIYKNIQNAQLFVMPGATHFMLREEHSLFNQIVERFFDNPYKRPTTKERINE